MWTDFLHWVASLLLALLLAVQAATAPSVHWQSIRATYYGTAPDGLLGHRTADGTILTSSSLWLAANNVPMHAWVILTYRGRSLLLQVKDRTGRGHYFDLTFGACSWLRHCFSGPLQWRLAYP